MRSLRRRLGTALVVAVLLGTAGCGSGHHASTGAAPGTSAPSQWPLTGVRTGAPADRPALAVKIENLVVARPQTGLGAADMVWEELVEGGITRFVAVYQSSVPPAVGPVRSIRPMDPAIAAPLHGLFAFAGGQPPFPAAVAAAGLQVLSTEDGARGFYRISSRRAPHNLYADPAALLRQADASHRRAPPPQFAFAASAATATAATAGTPTSDLNVTMSATSHPRWSWSAPDAAWLRAEDGTPAVEVSGRRLHAANVVVLRVDVVTTAYLDPAGNHVPETKLLGTGTALVASGGRTLAATWAKGSLGSPVQLTADGAPVRLAPGTTWIELVPNGTGAVSATR